MFFILKRFLQGSMLGNSERNILRVGLMKIQNDVGEGRENAKEEKKHWEKYSAHAIFGVFNSF